MWLSSAERHPGRRFRISQQSAARYLWPTRQWMDARPVVQLWGASRLCARPVGLGGGPRRGGRRPDGASVLGGHWSRCAQSAGPASGELAPKAASHFVQGLLRDACGNDRVDTRSGREPDYLATLWIADYLALKISHVHRLPDCRTSVALAKRPTTPAGKRPTSTDLTC